MFVWVFGMVGFRLFFELGIKNILSKNTGSTNAINVVKALEHGLLNLKDPLMIAKQRGITVKQLFS